MRKFLSTFAPVAAGVGAAAIVTFATPAFASTQFTARVQAPNRILTSQHLFAGEVLHVGLDGFSVRVISVQSPGGGTVAWVSPFLPKADVGKVVVFSA